MVWVIPHPNPPCINHLDSHLLPELLHVTPRVIVWVLLFQCTQKVSHLVLLLQHAPELIVFLFLSCKKTTVTNISIIILNIVHFLCWTHAFIKLKFSLVGQVDKRYDFCPFLHWGSSQLTKIAMLMYPETLRVFIFYLPGYLLYSLNDH